MVQHFDTIILGAGAAGMMAAIRAGKRGRKVLVLDHGKAPGEKIRISGGGRCNFTNVHTTAKNFYSQNPHFAKSALARYRPDDFIALVKSHGIAFHEKALGQLFCDNSATDIVSMLLSEMRKNGVELHLRMQIHGVEHRDQQFIVKTEHADYQAPSLIVATGGKTIPKMGATGFAYRIAEQFGLGLVETRPALVPLTLDPAVLESFAPLAGVAVEARASHGKTAFEEAVLFTHRGLSGPAILQISSVWREGDTIDLCLEPSTDFRALLKSARTTNGRAALQTVLATALPKRLAQLIAEDLAIPHAMADLSDKTIDRIAERLTRWQIKPAGSEGFRTAEVTLGGVDTADLDSRTLQAKAVPGLYFIGECVDVTGWLGGYNFQWAWASGVAAGDAA